MLMKIMMILISDTGANIGQGGRSVENGTSTDCDVIISSEF